MEILAAAHASLRFWDEFRATIGEKADSPRLGIEAVGVVVEKIDEQHALLYEQMFFEKSAFQVLVLIVVVVCC